MDRKIIGVIVIIVLTGIVLIEFYKVAFTIPELEEKAEYYQNSTQTLCAVSNIYAYSINTLIQNYSLPYNQFSYLNCTMIGEFR